MNMESSMCASSGRAQDWDQMDWSKYERKVRRLQARIVKASREGHWNKVKTLQRLLTHSFSGKALAVKRVTENQGKRTSGMDGVLWSTPAAKLRAIESMQHRGYRPLPLRRVYIPKATENKGRSVFPLCPTEPCRPYTCWRWHLLRKPPPTRIPTASVQSVPLQTP